MTTIFMAKRLKADQAKVLDSKRRVLSNTNRVAFAEKISRWCWKPIKNYSADGVINPLDKNQIRAFLFNEVYPEFGVGVYKLNGTVNGLKGTKHFGTYAIYLEGEVLKTCLWDDLKERCVTD